MYDSPKVSAKILNATIRLNNANIRYESFNPFIRRYGGQEVEGTRLVISNLPFSYSNKAVENNLRACGYRLRSHIQFEKARGPDRMLSDWKTGRRYLWADLPTKTMTKNVKMGDFMAYLYYKEMKKSQECYRCLEVGHRASECENEEVCLTCRKPGHRRGDPICGLDVVSEADYAETDEEKDDADAKNENEEKGKDDDEKEDNETGSSTETNTEVSEIEESSSNEQDEEGSEKEEGELDEEKNVSGELQKNVHKGEEAKTKELTVTQVSIEGEKETKENTRDKSGKSTGKETLVKVSNHKKDKHKKKRNKAEVKNFKEIKASSSNETPKSSRNHSSLGDFGIGFKRSIHEAPSPDEVTGSPQKKGPKKK